MTVQSLPEKMHMSKSRQPKKKTFQVLVDLEAFAESSLPCTAPKQI